MTEDNRIYPNCNRYCGPCGSRSSCTRQKRKKSIAAYSFLFLLFVGSVTFVVFGLGHRSNCERFCVDGNYGHNGRIHSQSDLTPFENGFAALLGAKEGDDGRLYVVAESITPIPDGRYRTSDQMWLSNFVIGDDILQSVNNRPITFYRIDEEESQPISGFLRNICHETGEREGHNLLAVSPNAIVVHGDRQIGEDAAIVSSNASFVISVTDGKITVDEIHLHGDIFDYSGVRFTVRSFCGVNDQKAHVILESGDRLSELLHGPGFPGSWSRHPTVPRTPDMEIGRVYEFVSDYSLSNDPPSYFLTQRSFIDDDGEPYTKTVEVFTNLYRHALMPLSGWMLVEEEIE